MLAFVLWYHPTIVLFLCYIAIISGPLTKSLSSSRVDDFCICAGFFSYVQKKTKLLLVDFKLSFYVHFFQYVEKISPFIVCDLNDKKSNRQHFVSQWLQKYLFVYRHERRLFLRAFKVNCKSYSRRKKRIRVAKYKIVVNYMHFLVFLRNY